LIVVERAPWAVDAVGDALGVSPVLGPVGSIDLVVDAVVRVHEGDVFLDPTATDVAFASYPGATEPRLIMRTSYWK
jgi:hypothetical protein